MSYKHIELSNGGFQSLSLAKQMLHIGSEVSRAINWKNKNNQKQSASATYRALELLDFTIKAQYGKYNLKEFSRMKEVLCDYFLGDNIYNSDDSLQKQFDIFIKFL